MDKIHVGIIGLGRISDLHALGYRDNPEARIYAVCTTNEKTGLAKKAEWSAEKYYRNYEELLSDPGVDAVEILTPQKLHEKMVSDAVAAGKHIMVQKPMTIDIPSAVRMLEAVKRSDKVYKVIENYIFYPPLVRAKQMIDSGVIGDPIGIRIRFVSGSSGGWDIPAKSWEWRMRENIEGRGMQTFDHGHHMWCVAWYLLGEIERVFAWIDSSDGIIDCPATIMWKYRDATRYGICDYSHCSELHIPSDYYANDEWFEITGSKGIIMVNRCTGKVRKGPSLSHFDGSAWHHEDDLDTDWAAGFKGATQNFINAVMGRELPLLSGEQALKILKIAVAVIRSSRQHREVYIDEFDAEDPEGYARERRREDIQKDSAGRRGLSLEELERRGRIL